MFQSCQLIEHKLIFQINGSHFFPIAALNDAFLLLFEPFSLELGQCLHETHFGEVVSNEIVDCLRLRTEMLKLQIIGSLFARSIIGRFLVRQSLYMEKVALTSITKIPLANFNFTVARNIFGRNDWRKRRKRRSRTALAHRQLFEHVLPLDF